MQYLYDFFSSIYYTLSGCEWHFFVALRVNRITTLILRKIYSFFFFFVDSMHETFEIYANILLLFIYLFIR